MSEAKIDEKRMAEIEARVRAATHGPWGHGEGVIGPYVDHMISGGGYLDPPDHEAVWLGGSVDEADRAFIAEARTDIPDLIADLRATRAEVERLRAERGEREIGFAEAAHNIALTARAEERKAIADDLHGIGLTEAALPGEAEVARRLEKRIRARGGRS